MVERVLDPPVDQVGRRASLRTMAEEVGRGPRRGATSVKGKRRRGQGQQRPPKLGDGLTSV